MVKYIIYHHKHALNGLYAILVLYIFCLPRCLSHVVPQNVHMGTDNSRLDNTNAVSSALNVQLSLSSTKLVNTLTLYHTFFVKVYFKRTKCSSVYHQQMAHTAQISRVTFPTLLCNSIYT